MTKKLDEKLFKLQGEIGTIKKDSTNPHFKNSYFDINKLIETIQPLLQSNGLLLTQPIFDNTQYSRITDVESGSFVESGIQLPNEMNPQKMGSAITYYRRYTLTSLLALQAEDDDANAAAGHTVKGNATDKDFEWLNEGTDAFQKAKQYIQNGGSIAGIRKKYRVSKETAAKLC